jgi:hypothetical protein
MITVHGSFKDSSPRATAIISARWLVLSPMYSATARRRPW